MRRVCIVVFVCMAFFAACSGGNEKSAALDKGYQPSQKQSPQQTTTPETSPAVQKETVKKSMAPAPRINNSEWKDWDDLTEEQYEEQVEKLTDRLDEIVDEYDENDEDEEIDADTLLKKLQQELPEHMRDNLPEEVREEIEWWTE